MSLKSVLNFLHLGPRTKLGFLLFFGWVGGFCVFFPTFFKGFLSLLQSAFFAIVCAKRRLVMIDLLPKSDEGWMNCQAPKVNNKKVKLYKVFLGGRG